MSDARSETSEWLIKRNCSAGPGQLALVFGSLVAVSCVFGLGFAVFGLWMVLPFVGLELAAVGAAFLVYGRHAADFERIQIAPAGVGVERTEGDAKQQWRLDPRVCRVQIESRGPGWGQRVRVYLLAPGIKLELGRYLLDRRRAQLARELDGVLLRARAAPFDSRVGLANR
ncbi:MAG: DUF2244 domain-containing protein [Burkholderiaceae bacterium]